MDARKHRRAALAVLAVGLCVLVTWGRSMALETAEIRTIRGQLSGHWVATSIDLSPGRKAEGSEAAKCSAEFDGKAVKLRGLVGGIDAVGTFYIEGSHPMWIDLKLDEGWIVGVYSLEGDRLLLCLNPFAPPERLGVPTLGRPREFAPGHGRAVYTFRRASGGA